MESLYAFTRRFNAAVDALGVPRDAYAMSRPRRYTDVLEHLFSQEIMRVQIAHQSNIKR